MAIDGVHPIREKAGSLEIGIFPKYSEITKLVCSLKKFLARHNFSSKNINEISLVLEELAVNTITHGYKNVEESQREKIDIRMECDNGKAISIVFKDAGIPFDSTLPRPPRNENTIGGWGLTLVQKMLQHFTYERDGNHNILRMFTKFK